MTRRRNLHASEVVFWQNLLTQTAALIQTVPDMDDTEIVIETTANGYNEFRKYWRKAEAGESEFMPIFLPWSIDTAYRARPSVGFEMTADERQLAELHELDAEQVCWRRNKISQLGDENRFCQECPLTPSEAFISSDFASFIAPELVLKPRKEKIEPHGPLLIGVDPAGNGPDRTSIAYRRGHVTKKIISKRSLDTAIVGNVESRGEGSHRNQRNNPMHLDLHQAPRCRARTRRGSLCQSPAMKNGRCRMHGGMSPGAPKGNKNALKHGRYTAEAIARRREVAELIRVAMRLTRRADG